MSEKRTIRGRGVTPGTATGEAVISEAAFMFAHGVEPKNGDVIDIRSPLLGENVKGKVLIFPFGKGSTTGSAWFLETIRQGNGPCAVINVETEPIIATALILGRLLYDTRIPLVDRLEADILAVARKGDIITVNGDTGEVTIVP